MIPDISRYVRVASPQFFHHGNAVASENLHSVAGILAGILDDVLHHATTTSYDIQLAPNHSQHAKHGKPNKTKVRSVLTCFEG